MILKQIAKVSPAIQIKREQGKKKRDHSELHCVSTQHSAKVKDNPGRTRALKEYFIHGTESGVLSKDEKLME